MPKTQQNCAKYLNVLRRLSIRNRQNKDGNHEGLDMCSLHRDRNSCSTRRSLWSSHFDLRFISFRSKSTQFNPKCRFWWRQNIWPSRLISPWQNELKKTTTNYFSSRQQRTKTHCSFVCLSILTLFVTTNSNKRVKKNENINLRSPRREMEL